MGRGGYGKSSVSGFRSWYGQAPKGQVGHDDWSAASSAGTQMQLADPASYEEVPADPTGFEQTLGDTTAAQFHMQPPQSVSGSTDYERQFPPCMVDPCGAATVVEEFLGFSNINEDVANKLRSAPPHVQEAVVARGNLGLAKNPSFLLLARIKSAEARAANDFSGFDAAPDRMAPQPIEPLGRRKFAKGGSCKGNGGGKQVSTDENIAGHGVWKGDRSCHQESNDGTWMGGLTAWTTDGNNAWMGSWSSGRKGDDGAWKGSWAAGPKSSDGFRKGFDSGLTGEPKGKRKWGAGQMTKSGVIREPGVYYEGPGVGIAGLKAAVHRSLEPHEHKDSFWSLDQMVNKVCIGIFKPATKWYKEDRRADKRGTRTQAQVLIEEFVEKVMASLAHPCEDKPWFTIANFTEPIALAAVETFKGTHLFHRIVAPSIMKYVSDAIHRYREEERITQVLWDAVADLGLSADYQKKCNKHLQLAYDQAHVAAEYGTNLGDTPELGMVEDFLTAWMSDFVKRSWDILENGIRPSDPHDQIWFLTRIFHYLTDPSHSCIPTTLLESLECPPPAGWPFISEELISIHAEAHAPAPKKGAAGRPLLPAVLDGEPI